jgi:hypothetical protein
MSTATLAPTDLVIEDLELSLEDEVPCYRCADPAVVLIIATCCKAQETMCSTCAAKWRAKVDRFFGLECSCRGCGKWIPVLTEDWYRVVPL